MKLYITPEQFQRFKNLETECGFGLYQFDEVMWIKGVIEILGFDPGRSERHEIVMIWDGPPIANIERAKAKK